MAGVTVGVIMFGAIQFFNLLPKPQEQTEEEEVEIETEEEPVEEEE